MPVGLDLHVSQSPCHPAVRLSQKQNFLSLHPVGVKDQLAKEPLVPLFAIQYLSKALCPLFDWPILLAPSTHFHLAKSGDLQMQALLDFHFALKIPHFLRMIQFYFAFGLGVYRRL
jgi:hypothetical protein